MNHKATTTDQDFTAASPYLTIVATSRNDDHGGDPLIRTQVFINCLAAQCAKFQLHAELILVDWNPPIDKPTLSTVLTFPDSAGYLDCRVVVVPPEIHREFKYSDRLQLFQMIGKNVGIRRARGAFVLATNIDIIFSDELMAFIGNKQLSKHAHYRVDRCDIQSGGLTPETPLNEALDYAWANIVRNNRRLEMPPQLEQFYADNPNPRGMAPVVESRKIADLFLNATEAATELSLSPHARFELMHTNACGDFALMSREGWNAVRGYPEFEAYSFNIDSMGLASSHYGGFHEISLLPPCVCFHIEHNLGSGWSEAGQGRLFGRLKTLNIESPAWPVLMPLVDTMRKEQRSIDFNYEKWGLAGYDLPESLLGEPCHTSARPQYLNTIEREQAGAIKPKYDYDHLARCHENLPKRNPGFATATISSAPFRLYVPDEFGNYAPQNRLTGPFLQAPDTPVVFSLNAYPSDQPLCLIPCDQAGLIDVQSIRAVDQRGKIVLNIERGTSDRPVPCGDARSLGDERGSTLMYVSTGPEPMLILPSIKDELAFPLLIIIQLTVHADRRLSAS